MAIALLQSTSKSAGAVTTSTLTFVSSVAAGSLKIAGVGGANNVSNSTSASDNVDGAYTQDVTQGFSTGTIASINSKPGATTGGTTVTFSQAVLAQLRCVIEEWGGAATIAPLDGTPSSGTNNNSNTFNCGAGVTTTQANDLILALMLDSGGTAVVTAGSGYILDTGSVTNRLVFEYSTSNAPGLQTATFGLSAIDSGPAMLVAYKASGLPTTALPAQCCF